MSSDSREAKAAKIRHLLETESEAIEHNITHLNEERYEAYERAGGADDLRQRARDLKEDAISRLPELIETVTEAVEANGGSVYVAEDAADANEYVASVMAEADAESVVKSKSMTTEEVDFNEHLADEGYEVWETDLGEFVVQLAEEGPSHIVGPSLHKSREEIADLLNETFDPDPPLETPAEMTTFARDFLGDRIREADVGVTGANFVLAESGSLVLVTNEGNARRVAVTPDTHVAVAGVEKLLPSVDELGTFVDLIARAATGQDVPQYLSVFTPPTDSPTLDFEGPGADEPLSAADGERDFHLVLLDNGRMDMRHDDDLRETLYCIRCGACANSCANFQSVGGHAFGGETYTGGIATGWETGVHGIDSAADFNDLCTGCSRCVNACPVKIDIPWINTVVRDRLNRGADESDLDFLVEGLTPDEEPGGVDLQKRFFGNFETLAKLGSATAPLSNWVADLDISRRLMERFLGIDRRRDLPAFQRETLADWYADHRPHPNAGTGDRSVVLFPDVYTNYVQVERGKAAVRVLEALGADVELAPPMESGRAPLSQGMIATADAHASRVHGALVEYVDDGRDVVVVEPSDVAMFRREYERLLPEASYERLAENAYEIMEYVYGLLENGADPSVLGSPGTSRVAYHSHCQQRTLGLEGYTEAVLDRCGVDAVTSDVECCGMAGSFGYKTEYYELSMDVGERLQEQFSTDRTRDLPVVASGTSCLDQLDALLSRPTRHPIELVDPA
ncbi:MAG: LUD domain-containing protein [Halobacteriaceae archaeon]